MADQAEPVVPEAPAAAAPPAAPAAPPPAPAAPAPSSPWAQSLQARFTDPAQQAAVDAYVREEIQPYVTRREQELGQVGEIWENLQSEEQSIPTYLAMAEQMYGPEVAEVLANALTAHIEAQTGEAPGPPEGGAEPELDEDQQLEQWLSQQPPQMQEYLREQFSEREDQSYQSEIGQIPGGQEIIAAGALPHFSRYVLAAQGDTQAAKALWDQEMGPVFEAAKQNPELAQSLGFTFGAPAPAAEPAPTVLGGTGATGGPAPPVEQNYKTMDDAMDDFFAAVAPSNAARQA